LTAPLMKLVLRIADTAPATSARVKLLSGIRAERGAYVVPSVGLVLGDGFLIDTRQTGNVAI
jgi:hypothetical protein